MIRRRTGRMMLAAAVGALALVATVTVPSSAQQPNLSAKTATAGARATAFKAQTSRIAKTDPALLGQTGSNTIQVLVKLDYDSLSVYSGGINGFAATSPSVTGGKLNADSDASQRYSGYIAGIESRFSDALRQAVPSAEVTRSYRVVYGGVAVKIPANKVETVLSLPGVVAVQADSLNKALTDASGEFIGADTLYNELGGSATAGSGVIVGVIDTGIWPEHPSFEDKGVLGKPPPRADHHQRVCDLGDNPLTPAPDPFQCNHKLIGGGPYLDTYNSVFPGTEVYPHSGRDSNGHGTHTSSTSTGITVDNVPVFGVDRGPITGIAPGAWLIMYKALGALGGFDTDLLDAVQSAVADGVDVINYSIGRLGGGTPPTDPIELAFLDAFAAGVFVSASAGNDGPGASTVDHLSPWLMTVAASTQARSFESTLTLTDGPDSLDLTGSSIMGGVASPMPVVLSSAPPYSHLLCDAPAAPGTFTGKIVACQRGTIARVEKGYNVMQGGAAGMILYNAVLADTETDNHWLPALHLADGTEFLAWMAAHPNSTGSFTAGQKVFGEGDVMAAFSSRGPGAGSFFIKPDITAPGVQILAGASPTPDDIVEGPPGQFYQAIAGTSMSAPHIAGSAALLKDLHPTWTPGQIKSALMTTATTDVVKEDETTAADPFDFGSGREDLNVAGDPGVTFDETVEHYATMSTDPVHAIDLNVPSINAPSMPGAVTTTRTATNVSGETLNYTTSATQPATGKITVKPSHFKLLPGASQVITVTIQSTAKHGQQFGAVLLDTAGTSRDVHLPVAFEPGQGAVTLASACNPNTIAAGESSQCTVTATNTGSADSTVDLTSSVSNMKLTAVQGATQTGPNTVELNDQLLVGEKPGNPSIGPGSLFGYLALADFGVAPIPIGDEEIINFSTLPFEYADDTYSAIGVVSNGYIVVGGGDGDDVACCPPPPIPDPARPNNILAPFASDLDGSDSDGIYAATLTDDVTGDSWIVVEWHVNLFGTATTEVMQVWIGLNGTEDITFAYDPGNLPQEPPPGYGLTIGAENADGSAGGTITGGPTEDLRVTSTAGQSGGVATYQMTVKGNVIGRGTVSTQMDSDVVAGTTVVQTQVKVTAAGAPTPQ